MGKFDGRVGIVSGSARGQGAAMARMLVDEGASVVVSDIRDELGAAVADELGDRAMYVSLDVRDPIAWDAAVQTAVSRFGKLDMLVNNAGVNLSRSIDDTSIEDFRHLFEVNTLGCWLGMKSVHGTIRDAGGGSIVNIGSISIHTALADKSAYQASKCALAGVTKTAALEFGADNIRVNAVHPGGVASDMTSGMPDATFAGQPIPRIGRPSDVASAVLFFLCDDSPYCTGTEISVDGGRLISAQPTPSQPAAESGPTSTS